ncbi:MAG: GNAT family N-acetyltransferase [Bacteroidia bacterium]|nr:GNAT family N-acetyltransferase [Bacteroidia bacterium]
MKRTTSDNPDFQSLVHLLDTYLKIVDGEDHAFYSQYNKTDTLSNVIVCYVNGSAVGCGAFRKFDTTTVEIKRMFVHHDFRRQGIGEIILKELETWAAELNYAACILETAKKQQEAIKLYEKSGYMIIPNYGPYVNVDTSVSMKKLL